MHSKRHYSTASSQSRHSIFRITSQRIKILGLWDEKYSESQALIPSSLASYIIMGCSGQMQ